MRERVHCIRPGPSIAQLASVNSSKDQTTPSPSSAEAEVPLSVSVQEYFEAQALSGALCKSHWGRCEQRAFVGVERALDECKRRGAIGTFYFSSWVAQRAPDSLIAVARAGHELGVLASAVDASDPSDLDEFRTQLISVRRRLVDIAGVEALGVRVAAFDLRLVAVAREVGFAFLSDGQDTVALNGESLRVEHAETGTHGLRRYSRRAFERACSSGNAVHTFSWELDVEQPRITSLGRLAAWRHYDGLSTVGPRLARLLAAKRAVPVARRLGLEVPVARLHPAPNVVAPPAYVSPLVERRTPVTVVIPCYNEQEGLSYLANALREFERHARDRYAVSYVFVDDGSTDRTWNLLTALAADAPHVQLVRHEANRGIAAAIASGLAHASSEFVCSLDADCTYDPLILSDLVAALESGADLVTASPYHSLGRVVHVPGWRLALSRTLSRLYRWRIGAPLHTWTACVRGYRRSRVAELAVRNSGYLGITELLLRALGAGLRVVEVPATLESRILGHSKLKVARVVLGHVGMLVTAGRLDATGTRDIGRAHVSSAGEVLR